MAEKPRNALRIEVSDLEDSGRVTVLEDWENFQVETDFREGTTSWSATISDSAKHRGLFARGGDTVRIFNHGALVLTGIVDEPSDDASPDAAEFQLAGRDMSSFLKDSDIPHEMWNIDGKTLKQLAEKWTEPFRKWIPGVVIDNAPSRYIMLGRGGRASGRSGGAIGNAATFGFVIENAATSRRTGRYGKSSPVYAGISEGVLNNKIGPGMKFWEQLRKFALQVGAHIAMTVDGKLWIGRPRYDQDPSVYGRGLVFRWSDDPKRPARTDGNVSGVRYQTSIAGRNSEIQIIGQGASKKTAIGRQLLRRQWVTKDPGPSFWERSPEGLGARRLYRPATKKIKRVDDVRLVRRIARTIMEERLIDGYDHTFLVDGHASESGALWATETMVSVIDERHGIEKVMMITKVSRTFSVSAETGEQAVITVIPRDIWLATNHDTTPNAAYEKSLVPLTWW